MFPSSQSIGPLNHTFLRAIYQITEEVEGRIAEDGSEEPSVDLETMELDDVLEWDDSGDEGATRQWMNNDILSLDSFGETPFEEMIENLFDAPDIPLSPNDECVEYFEGSVLRLASVLIDLQGSDRLDSLLQTMDENHSFSPSSELTTVSAESSGNVESFADQAEENDPEILGKPGEKSEDNETAEEGRRGNEE